MIAPADARQLRPEELSPVVGGTAEPTDTRSDDRALALTERQRQIAALIARGYTNPQIAAELALPPDTVCGVIQQLFDRLGCRSRLQIAHWVLKRQPPRGR